jgi:putative ABC transport system substrate-binding protein
MLVAFDDPDLKAFKQELARLGWSEGRNIHIEYRYAPAASQVRTLAKELVALQPEVIFAQSRPVTAALQQETQTIPVVFSFVIDPIGAGFIASLPRPGGNLTGFTVWEPGVVGKWLTMLKEIAPQTTRVALMANPDTAAYYDYLLHAAEKIAPSLGIEVVPSRISNEPTDIERVIAGVASVPNGSLAVLPDSTTSIKRDLIVALALAIACQRFTTAVSRSWRAALCLLASSMLTSIGRQRRTSIESFAAPNPATFRCRRQQSTKPSSTSRRPKTSA